MIYSKEKLSQELQQYNIKNEDADFDLLIIFDKSGSIWSDGLHQKEITSIEYLLKKLNIPYDKELALITFGNEPSNVSFGNWRQLKSTLNKLEKGNEATITNRLMKFICDNINIIFKNKLNKKKIIFATDGQMGYGNITSYDKDIMKRSTSKHIDELIKLDIEFYIVAICGNSIDFSRSNIILLCIINSIINEIIVIVSEKSILLSSSI